ncbi:MAG: DUF389 domain-containing protein [Planctomycetes bacterium]|nr:DUF389 domain-containing protein [Planctomycetota bacterium]
MATVVLLDPEASVAAQLRWAVWLAAARDEPLTLLVPKGGGDRSRERVRAELRAALLADPAFAYAGGADPDPAEVAPDGLRAQLVDVDLGAVDSVRAALTAAGPALFVVLRQQLDPRDEVAGRLGRELLGRVPCAVAVVRLGDGEVATWPPARLLVAASRGPHPRAAVTFAAKLARRHDGALVGAYVEPDIGGDAGDVGRGVLDRVLRRALGDGAPQVGREVVVADVVEDGLAAAAERVRADVVLCGVPRPGMLGPRFHGTAPARLCRRTKLPVVLLRDALPLGGRLRRAIEERLVRVVPQVEREVRVELADRVQSSSAWTFDFVALLSLATAIAALGLLQDSAAVIIGAMLIAPLMTPILGVGLALAHGNRRLAGLAWRSIVRGVATAYALALLLGLLLGIGDAAPPPTGQMLARGWPGVSDLLVAFVSGLAAAYANSRPGLVAALPGVAIAAALVPPIATSGLATAAGQWELAYGAMLLFVVNMVAIVLAASLSLWAVGVRSQREGGWLRHVGTAFTVATLALVVHLVQRTHVGGAVPLPQSAVGAARAALPTGFVLAGMTAEQAEGHLVVHATIAGPGQPPPAAAAALLDVLAPLLTQPLRVDLDYAWRASAGAGVPAGR